MKPTSAAVWTFGAAFALCAATAVSSAATVSGTVAFPVSDGGYSPRTVGSKVRVMGTALSTNVAEIDFTSGSFTLNNVPTGPVTLILEEPTVSGAIGDRFTQDSKRVELLVSGDVTDVTFDLVYHWRNLPSYPPPYQDSNYDQWEPHFISPLVGFMGFQNRGVSPFEFELWRTTDGGDSWSKIGHWINGDSEQYPDFSGPSMMFVDADHGIMRGGGTATTFPPHRQYGVIRTADGGQTWTYVDLPNAPAVGDEPGGNGLVSIVNFGAIDATHWIICGSENVGTYMGSGTPGWVTIWETADAGANWWIALTRREDYGTCSAMGVDPSGQAFVFDTPYPFGGSRVLSLRDTNGVWTVRPGNWEDPAGNDIVTNTGYGVADAPMIDGTAWVAGGRWVGNGTVESGVFRSLDGGSSWHLISTSLLQNFDFGTLLRAYATAGGPAYASYDGGRTWRFQAQGGGVCCHGNYMFAFSATDAFWKDAGVGDPNGKGDVLRYLEQAAPYLEVLKGTGAGNVTVLNGTTNVPALALNLTSHGLTDLLLQPLRIKAIGSAHDRNELDRVSLWWDRNANGTIDSGDTAISSTIFTADNGEAILDLGGVPELHQLFPRQLLVTYDISLRARPGVTFTATLRPEAVEALVADTSSERVTATAPIGTLIAGGTITVQAVVPIPPAITPQAALEGTFYSFNAPMFRDPDGQDLTYRFTGLPPWLTVYNPTVNPRFLYGRPPYTESTSTSEANYTIGYEAEDPSGNKSSTSFTLSIVNVNATPVAPDAIPAQYAPEGLLFSYGVPPFTDPDGDALDYSYSGLPPWLSVANPTANPRYLMGTPPYTDSGPVSEKTYWITVTATDPFGKMAARSFSLTVNNRNGPPQRPESIPPQTAVEGQYFSYAVPVFPDPDGEPVTYTFTGLPGWLSVYNPDVNPRFLYGRPPFTESGPTTNKVYWIMVTATDPNNLSSSRAFTLTVLNAN